MPKTVLFDVQFLKEKGVCVCIEIMLYSFLK